MNPAQDSSPKQTSPESEASSRLTGFAYWSVIALGCLGLLMAINQTFNLSLLGFQPLGNAYLYYLIGIFLAAALIVFPAWSGAKSRVSWYDWPLALLALGPVRIWAITGW